MVLSILGVVNYISLNLELFCRMHQLSTFSDEVLHEIDANIGALFIDAPYLHFTSKRKKYIEGNMTFSWVSKTSDRHRFFLEFVLNVLQRTTPPPKEDKKNRLKESSLEDEVNVQPLNLEPPSNPDDPQLQIEEKAEVAASSALRTMPIASTAATLSEIEYKNLTPKQRKELKQLQTTKITPDKSLSATPPKEKEPAAKPVWGGSVASNTSSPTPSLSSIMSEEKEKGGSLKSGVVPAYMSNKSTPEKSKFVSPKAAWGAVPSAPIKFEEIEKIQLEEKKSQLPSTPIEVKKERGAPWVMEHPNGGPSSPMKINPKILEEAYSKSPSSTSPLSSSPFSQSPSSGPVVHRHLWGAPTTAATAPVSISSKSKEGDEPWLAPTPMDSLSIKAAERGSEKKGGGKWAHTPNLLNIMSEQFAEKIVKEDETVEQEILDLIAAQEKKEEEERKKLQGQKNQQQKAARKKPQQRK